MAEEICPPGKKCGKTKRRLASGSGKVIAGKVAKVAAGIGIATAAGIAALKNKDKLKQEKKGGSVKTVKRKK
jgi:hypothetical protein